MSGPHFEFQIRESARAKYMSLRVTVERGLEVVVPRGFNRNLVLKFVRDKADWVQTALSKVQVARDRLRGESIECRPAEVDLQSIGKKWTVDYLAKSTKTTSLFDDGHGRLQICGRIENSAACQAVLRRWTQRQAFSILIPWLRGLSHETGIAFGQTAIRCQKSRWGSCSTTGTISLNQKLLFVEPDLVRYVLIHELCHMREMNHSRHYWKLVGQFYPDYRSARRRLKDAWYRIPSWVEKP